MGPFQYRVLVERSEPDDCFLARVPALNVAAHGDTEAEAVREAKVAAELMLAVMRADGEEPPAPDVSLASLARP